MKVKQGFMLREVVGQWVVVPLGTRVVEFNGIMTLSESGALLWKKLTSGAEHHELVEVLLSEYGIDEETASADVKEFIDSLQNGQLIES